MALPNDCQYGYYANTILISIIAWSNDACSSRCLSFASRSQTERAVCTRHRITIRLCIISNLTLVRLAEFSLRSYLAEYRVFLFSCLRIFGFHWYSEARSIEYIESNNIYNERISSISPLHIAAVSAVAILSRRKFPIQINLHWIFGYAQLSAVAMMKHIQDFIIIRSNYTTEPIGCATHSSHQMSKQIWKHDGMRENVLLTRNVIKLIHEIVIFDHNRSKTCYSIEFSDYCYCVWLNFLL